MANSTRTLSRFPQPKITPTPYRKISTFVLTLLFVPGWAGLLFSSHRHWHALSFETRFLVMIFMVVYPMPWVHSIFREKLEPFMMATATQTYIVLLIAGQAIAA